MASTLAAELWACHEGAKAAIYIAAVLKGMMEHMVVTVRCITDNKSLVDALRAQRVIQDKGLRLHISVLKGMLENGELDEVDWIGSKDQLADALTKRGVCRDQLVYSISRA